MICRATISIAIFAAAIASASLACAQQPAELAARAVAALHKYTDNESCETCHLGQPKNSTFLGYPHPEAASVTQRWRDHDKHRNAFKLLYMGKDEHDEVGKAEKQALVKNILGFELTEAFEAPDSAGKLIKLSARPDRAVQVAKVKLCLHCHSSWPQPETDEEPRVALEQGVSCQVCHGPGLAWKGTHDQLWWRLVTPEAKHDLGMIDVRDPVVRARLCASCHVGDYDQQRFIPHEWYALGHPPLPSFEYSTFAASMPAHWRPIAEKKDFEGKEPNDARLTNRGVNARRDLRTMNIDIPEAAVKASYREANFPPEKYDQHEPFEDLPRLKDTLISSVVVQQMYVDLVRKYAAASSAKSSSAPWPEFALYDCASCHHELRSGPGYPQRPYGKHPVGRPPAQVWPSALSKVALLNAKQSDAHGAEAALRSYTQAQDDFERSLTATIFGKRDEIVTAAGSLHAELDRLIGDLRYSRFDPKAAHRALLVLTDQQQVETRDYHSARQIAWSVREIMKDVRQRPYLRTGNDPLLTGIERLFDSPSGVDQTRRDTLLLRLPATQHEHVLVHLPLMSKAIEGFDAKQFSAQLSGLNERLRVIQPP